MAIEVRLSGMGINIAEATIAKWLKQEGDVVGKGDILGEAESEKVNFEIVAPESGTLLKRLHEEGAKAPVDSIIAVLGNPGEDISAIMQAAAIESSQAGKPTVSAVAESIPKPAAINALPAAKLLAKQRGVDIADVRGTGPGGRVTLDDVQNYSENEHLAAGTADPQREEVISMAGMRKVIADAMLASVRNSATVTTVAEIDMTELGELRGRLKSQWAKDELVPSFVPFVIVAAIDGIRRFPAINSEIRGDVLIVKKYVNFGVVVAVEDGLVTPVLRDAQAKTAKEITRDLAALTARAKARQLSAEELRGGTITLSNPGTFGAVMATPIIYPPQNAVLWMGRIAKTPVVRDDKIVIRSMMYLCLSYDHRALDGNIAAQFLQHVRQLLETPDALFQR